MIFFVLNSRIQSSIIITTSATLHYIWQLAIVSLHVTVTKMTFLPQYFYLPCISQPGLVYEHGFLHPLNGTSQNFIHFFFLIIKKSCLFQSFNSLVVFFFLSSLHSLINTSLSLPVFFLPLNTFCYGSLASVAFSFDHGNSK